MLTSVGINIGLISLAIVNVSSFIRPPVFQEPTTLKPLQANAYAGFSEYHMNESPNMSNSPPLTALEFFSGIGGLRTSLERATRMARSGSSGRDTAVIGSFDINTVANMVYEHNFRSCKITRRSIEHLSTVDVDGIADIWLLSPPCQPFCKVGKQMDVEDPRCLSLLHLVSLLEHAALPPSFIFLENVKGFEGSRAHARLLEVLAARSYDVAQYLLSPVQLGVPNTRLRYYCLASRDNGLTPQRKDRITPVQDSMPAGPSTPAPRTGRDAGGTWGRDGTMRPLSEYLDPSIEGAAAVPLLMSPKIAVHANLSLRFDIVTARSTETTTFTKGYGKHAGKAGPMILLTEDGTRRVSDEDLGRFPDVDLGPMGRELRWFSDREMLRLHGFPEWFVFPDELTLRQRFGLVGNSVNVDVVAMLLGYLLFGGATAKKTTRLEDTLARTETPPAVDA